MDRYSNQDRRKNKRIFLTNEDGIEGVFKFPDKEPITTNIMNLSSGGLQFVLDRKQVEKIAKGDYLQLEKIKGNEDLDFLSDIKLEVKWILDLQFFEHAGIGCEYKDASNNVVELMEKFVEDIDSKKKYTVKSE